MTEPSLTAKIRISAPGPRAVDAPTPVSKAVIRAAVKRLPSRRPICRDLLAVSHSSQTDTTGSRERFARIGIDYAREKTHSREDYHGRFDWHTYAALSARLKRIY
jgi:hypothetical protein